MKEIKETKGVTIPTHFVTLEITNSQRNHHPGRCVAETFRAALTALQTLSIHPITPGGLIVSLLVRNNHGQGRSRHIIKEKELRKQQNKGKGTGNAFLVGEVANCHLGWSKYLETACLKLT